MVDAIEVRAAVPDDAPGIADVHVSSWRSAYRGLLPQQFLDDLSLERRTRQWEQRLGDPVGTTLVAAGASAFVAGFAHGGPSRDEDADPRVGEVVEIYVREQYWGCGLGHALHEALVESFSADFVETTLWMLRGNQRAEAFYLRHGWRADGAEKSVLVRDVELNEVRFSRSLRSASSRPS